MPPILKSSESSKNHFSKENLADPARINYLRRATGIVALLGIIQVGETTTADIFAMQNKLGDMYDAKVQEGGDINTAPSISEVNDGLVELGLTQPLVDIQEALDGLYPEKNR